MRTGYFKLGEGTRGQRGGIGRHRHTLYTHTKTTGEFTGKEKNKKEYKQGIYTPMCYSYGGEKQ